MENKFELLLVLVNSGFADTVMDSAREQGARGGTIIHARGTGTKEMEAKYGVVITPDKEMVMILVNAAIKDAVMAAVNKACGLATDGQGIAFSLPVDDVVGLRFESPDGEEDPLKANPIKDDGEAAEK